MPAPIVPPGAEPTESLVRSVRRLAQAIDLRSREISRATGLTLPQHLVLQSVRTLGEVTTHAISTDVSMSPPTVVAVLDKLESKGLIARYRSTVDRRVVHARMTESGLGALDQAPDLLGEAFMTGFSRLSLARRQAMATALDELAGLLRPAGGRP